MSAAVSNPMPPLPELGAPSRLSVAFWLALAAEAALILVVVWAVTHEPAIRVSPRPVEQVRLVRLPKPIEKPKSKPELKRPEPVPRRLTFHPHPVPLPPPPVALPPPIALPPSPIAAPVAPPAPPPKAQPVVSASEKATYLGAIRAAIQEAVQFPADARMLRQEGEVRVKFELRDGVVSNVQIITPGRIKSFNSNALLAVHEASIPSPPKALAHHLFTLVLWVKFHLHRSL
jgi:protein TonB